MTMWVNLDQNIQVDSDQLPDLLRRVQGVRRRSGCYSGEDCHRHNCHNCHNCHRHNDHTNLLPSGVIIQHFDAGEIVFEIKITNGRRKDNKF